MTPEDRLVRLLEEEANRHPVRSDGMADVHHRARRMRSTALALRIGVPVLIATVVAAIVVSLTLTGGSRPSEVTAGPPGAPTLAGATTLAIVAVRPDDSVALLSLSGGLLRPLIGHAPGLQPGFSDPNATVAVDRAHGWAYLGPGAQADGTTCHVRDIVRLPDDNGGSARFFGPGLYPAVSPDGSHLAYAPAGGADPCNPTSIEVIDVKNGAKRVWSIPDPDARAHTVHPDRLSWAPDGRHLAVGAYYGQGQLEVAVVDTGAPASSTNPRMLSATTRDQRGFTDPTYMGNRNVIAAQKASCWGGIGCTIQFGSEIDELDPISGVTKATLIARSQRVNVTNMAFDPTGDSMAFVDDNAGFHLYRWTPQSGPTSIADGYVYADWTLIPAGQPPWHPAPAGGTPASTTTTTLTVGPAANPVTTPFDQCPNAAPLPFDSNARQNAIATARAAIPRIYTDVDTTGYTMGSAEPAGGGGYSSIPAGMCGATVGARTYVVQLVFPAMAPSASMSQGQLFVSRFPSGWQVWYRYH